MSKRLIVNADDFGMAIEVSRGIMQVARAGFVRATSVMANADDFSESMGELEGSGLELDVGFHATLTWGRPVSNPSEIPTLVGPDGRFHSKGKLLARSLVGLVSPDEAYRELWAQCERLSKRAPAVTHIDGHHHVHTFPGICGAVVRLAKERGIPHVRAPREGLWSPWRWATARRLVVSALPAASPAYWRSRGFACPDRFGGFALGARRNLKLRWLRLIENLPEGLCEVMVHPGYPTDKIDGYNEGRRDEVEVLTDPELMESAARSGVDICSFTS